jgi:hypothetical protein
MAYCLRRSLSNSRRAPRCSCSAARDSNNPQIEAEIEAWYDATSLDEEKTIVRRLNGLALDHVPYAPLVLPTDHEATKPNNHDSAGRHGADP